MDRAVWSQVRAVYARFGGATERNTTKENSTLYRMPGGVQVQGGRASDVNKKVGREGLKMIMQGVRRAGIPPILFLAAMAEQGVAFVSKSADVSKAQRWLKETNPDLTTKASWKTAERSLSEWIKERQVELAPLDRETESVPTQRQYPYTIREAVELTGREGKEATRLASQLAGRIRAENRLGRQLAAGGHLHTEQRGKRKFYHVDEPGAMIIARYVEERFGAETMPATQETTVEQPQPAKSKPKVEIPPPQPRSQPQPHIARPHIILDESTIAFAIMEYLGKRDMAPSPDIVFSGVSTDGGFSAEVEIHWKDEDAEKA